MIRVVNRVPPSSIGMTQTLGVIEFGGEELDVIGSTLGVLLKTCSDTAHST
jgi:hypothetical protein